MHFSKLSKEQGIVYVPILIAAIALIGFIFVSASADFKSNLFARLFPSKPKSHASEVSKIELIGNLGVGVTSLTQTYTNNVQAKLTYIPPVPSPTPFATASASVSSCPAGFYWNGDSCQQTTNPIPASSVPSSITPSPVPSVTPSQAANPVITNITPVSGSIGTEITITGTNFGLVPGQLAFCCAQPGADVIWSDTQIKAKVPRYARTGVLTVIVGTGLNQKFARSQAPFTVIQTTTTPALTTTPEIGSTAPIGVGGSVQGVAYTQTPILPSEYKVAVGNSQNEAQSAFNSAPSVPFNISEWQAPANNQSGYTKVISLQLPGGFGQKYAALQFMINGVWQQVLISAPINFVQAPTPSASPSALPVCPTNANCDQTGSGAITCAGEPNQPNTIISGYPFRCLKGGKAACCSQPTGDWRTITVPLTKYDSNFNSTGLATIQMSSGIVNTSAGVATVVYKFKFISLQIKGDQPNTWFSPRLCGSVANKPFCAGLSQPPTGGQTDSSGNLTFNYPNSSFQYSIYLPVGQTTANLGVFSFNQQAYCGERSMDSCTLRGTVDLSQLAPATSPTPTVALCPTGSTCVGLTPPSGSKTPQGSAQIRIESQGKGYKLTGNLSNLGVNKQYRVQLCKDGGKNCAGSGQMQLRTDQRGNASLPTAGASIDFNPNDNASFYNIAMVTDASFTINGCNTSNPCLRGEFSGITSNIPGTDLLCKADVNGDGFITIRDISSLTLCSGKKGTDMGSHNVVCSYADLNNDGIVNEKDVNDIIKPNFGKKVDRKTCKNWALLTPTTSPTPTPVPTPISVKIPDTDALCKADVNGDGFINGRDFSSLTVCVGEKVKTEARAKYACKYADLNGDGQVNEKDVDDVIKPNFLKTVDRKVCKNWTLWQALRVDVNGDGGAGSVDALFVKRYVSNLDKILGRNIGDVNNDGKITHDDAELVLKIAGNLKDPKTNQPFTADQKKRADVNRDGSPTSLDALLVDRFAQGTDKVLANIGDIDMDGKLTNTDADLILRFAINLPPQ